MSSASLGMNEQGSTIKHNIETMMESDEEAEHSDNNSELEIEDTQIASKEAEGATTEEEEEDDEDEDEEEDEVEPDWRAKVGEPPAGGALEEKQTIKALNWENVKTQPGQTWYLISTKWFQSWKDYVRYDDDDDDDDDLSDNDGDYATGDMPRPGPINNESLLEPQTEYLRRECLEGRHYTIAPSQLWKHLWNWYPPQTHTHNNKQ